MSVCLSQLRLSLQLVSLFRGVKQSPALCALLRILQAADADEKAAAYSDFLFALQAADLCFSEALLRLVFTDDNRYVRLTAAKEPIPEAMEALAERELSLFSALTELSPEDLFPDALPAGGIPADGGRFACTLPRFENKKTDVGALYRARLSQLHRFGFGVFAGGAMFRVKDERIVPIRTDSAMSPDEFVGYQSQRETVRRAFVSLLDGMPAENVLLYGDAGTGKSSTVKALVKDLADRGLRLIELKKDQLTDLPAVMEEVRVQPLKFVIFIDDLSFGKNDDQFSMLKAALEGSAAGTAENALICATSNRRHIVKETFSDRTGDDVHRNDTMTELLSLSDRFGLTVYYEKPNKAQYLETVSVLAARAGLPVTEELLTAAEAYALKKGSRSPRAAKQFVAIEKSL